MTVGRALIRGFAVAAVALLPEAAFGTAGDPQKRLTAADTSRASSVLLRRADLGVGGWKSGGSGSMPAACGIVLQLQPNESDLVETGAATGWLFTTKSYQALTQTVGVFATARQANTAWVRTVNKNLVICMEQQMENTSSMGAPVSVTDWTPLKLPRLVAHVAGFRVTATAKAGGKTSNVYFDLILLGHSRTMTRIAFSSLLHPFSIAYEVQLARIVSARLDSSAH
jgi:hypothetical protein